MISIKSSELDWMKIENRIDVLEEIYGSREELLRKYESFAQWEIYNGHIEPYVKKYLISQLGAKTVLKMPVVSSVNIARKVVKSESSIYRQSPYRNFSNGNDADVAAINAIYDDGKFNVKLQKANEYFKLQKQCLIQILPIQGKITPRILFPHNYDVIPNDTNAEYADSYIISTFDRQRYIQGDSAEKLIASQEDFKRKKSLDRFTVWSKEYNFVMDGHGNIMDPTDVVNHIGMLPFYDLATDKDFEYFVRLGSTDADFTVQYNAALSDSSMIVRLQGYAQAVVSGPSNLIPETLDVGPNTVLHLPTDPSNNTPLTFQFVTPSPNIDGTLRHNEALLANYLSSRGVDTNIIQASLNNGTGKAYSSGLERLLAMIDRFEASRADIDLFQDAEDKIFEIVKAWLLHASGSDLLDSEYHVSQAAQDIDMSIVYTKPENIQTETEKVAYMEQRMAIGVSDKLDALMYLDEMDEEEAQEQLDKLTARDKANKEDVAPVVQAVIDGQGNAANPVVSQAPNPQAQPSSNALPPQGNVNGPNTKSKVNA